MIDAMEYYIDNLGKETFVSEEERKSPYVTRDGLAAIEEEIMVGKIFLAFIKAETV